MASALPAASPASSVRRARSSAGVETVGLIGRAPLGGLLGGLAAGVQIAPARAAHADDAHEAAQRDQPDAVLGLAELRLTTAGGKPT